MKETHAYSVPSELHNWFVMEAAKLRKANVSKLVVDALEKYRTFHWLRELDLTDKSTMEILKWVEEKAKVEGVSAKQIILECIKLAREIEAAREKGVSIMIPGYTPLRIDKKTYSLLEEIADMVHMDDVNELLEYIISGMHAMLKLGVWKFLKPLPELAETAVKEAEQS